MAKRSTIARRRRALADDIREAVGDGTMAVGDMLPSARELASKYGLSHATVTRELDEMIDQGFLRAVPRVGTFIAKSMSVSTDLYLILGAPAGHARTWPSLSQIRAGFEDRIARLGGSSVFLPVDVAQERYRKGALSNAAGAFVVIHPRGKEPGWELSDAIPTVRSVSFSAPGAGTPRSIDVVNFDDVDGGRQATRHLVDLGCSRIAFLGLHPDLDPLGSYSWSRAREVGWVEESKAAGRDPDGLSFLPTRESMGPDDERAVAADSARALIGHAGVDGVVCASDNAALGLLMALREAGVPHAGWPAVVGFDGLPETESIILTSLRLPWQELGATAADLLWGRKSGRLTGPPQVRTLPMTLIPRMNFQPAWSEDVHDLLPAEAVAIDDGGIR